MRKLLVLLFLILPAMVSAEPVGKVYLGANAIWFDQGAALDLPSDWELGATGRASLSPHISVVGSAFYGVDHSYWRGSAGGRITATDVNNPDFSIGLGIQRQFSSDLEIRLEEWAPDATIAWRPWPASKPKVILGLQGNYGLDSQQASVLVGVRYQLGATPMRGEGQ